MATHVVQVAAFCSGALGVAALIEVSARITKGTGLRFIPVLIRDLCKTFGMREAQ